MGHLGVVLYEYLGEEYPEVLGSILGALKAIVNVIGMTRMTPPIKDLLPRLTPILKNRCAIVAPVYLCCSLLLFAGIPGGHKPRKPGILGDFSEHQGISFSYFVASLVLSGRVLAWLCVWNKVQTCVWPS